jgi:hypothetical protein
MARLRRAPRVRLEIQEPLGETLIVYRAVKTDDVQSPALLESFKSKPERGKPPRPGSPEESTPFIYEGLSAFFTLEAAIEHARELRNLEKPIGDFIAEVHLAPGEGFRYAFWGKPDHLTVVGVSIKLREAVVAIVPIEENSE